MKRNIEVITHATPPQYPLEYVAYIGIGLIILLLLMEAADVLLNAIHDYFNNRGNNKELD